MKAPTRRLGRGLGAFLDFGPADADGAARVSDAISAVEATSVLQTSKPAAPVPCPTSPPLAAVAASRPVTAVPSAPPVVDDSPFLDDDVGGLTFPDVEIE